MFLRVNNTKSLCETVVTTTRAIAPVLVDEAVLIQTKYECLLTRFSKCPSKYNSSEAVEDAQIDVLGKTVTLSIICSV